MPSELCRPQQDVQSLYESSRCGDHRESPRSTSPWHLRASYPTSLVTALDPRCRNPTVPECARPFAKWDWHRDPRRPISCVLIGTTETLTRNRLEPSTEPRARTLRNPRFSAVGALRHLPMRQIAGGVVT